jgi:hypothetical protein
MEIEKPKGKRGRPKKIVTDIVKEPKVKRGRGRPSSKPKDTVSGEKNIKIKEPEIEPLEEIYIPPKILRKKRVFTFDKKVFHAFVQKYGGDIIIMSYVFDNLMRLYIHDKIMLPSIDDAYYREWCKGPFPGLEPIEEKELSTSHAIMRGIPLQYKYPLLIEEDIFNMFQKKCKIYSLFVANLLVQMLLDEKNKINIDTSKYKEWCIL